MTDAAILYTGMFCFNLIMLAFVLTIREFKKMSRTEVRTPLEPARRGPIEARAR